MLLGKFWLKKCCLHYFLFLFYFVTVGSVFFLHKAQHHPAATLIWHNNVFWTNFFRQRSPCWRALLEKQTSHANEPSCRRGSTKGADRQKSTLEMQGVHRKTPLALNRPLERKNAQPLIRYFDGEKKWANEGALRQANPRRMLHIKKFSAPLPLD